MYIRRMYPKHVRIIALTGALLVWGAVIAQLILHLQRPDIPFGEALIQFFSYFTIQSNLLVACCFSSIASGGKLGPFFSRPTLLSATVVYITVVGAIYHVILSNLWHFTGFSSWVNQGLHSLNPLYFILFWAFFVPKAAVKWRHVWIWLIYPLAYAGFILIRGDFSGFYPYPFINVSELGWSKILGNIAWIFLLFAGLCVFVAALCKALSVNKSGPA